MKLVLSSKDFFLRILKLFYEKSILGTPFPSRLLSSSRVLAASERRGLCRAASSRTGGVRGKLENGSSGVETLYLSLWTWGYRAVVALDSSRKKNEPGRSRRHRGQSEARNSEVRRVHIRLWEYLKGLEWPTSNAIQETRDKTQLCTLTLTHLTSHHGLCDGQCHVVYKGNEPAIRAG